MRAKKIDANQTSIAEQAKALGISYQSLHELGKGCPDAIFGYAGINLFVEIKDGKNKLNEMQIEYHENWEGQIVVVKNVFELLQEFNLQSAAIYGMVKPEITELIFRYFEMKFLHFGKKLAEINSDNKENHNG